MAGGDSPVRALSPFAPPITPVPTTHHTPATLPLPGHFWNSWKLFWNCLTPSARVATLNPYRIRFRKPHRGNAMLDLSCLRRLFGLGPAKRRKPSPPRSIPARGFEKLEAREMLSVTLAGIPDNSGVVHANSTDPNFVEVSGGTPRAWNNAANDSAVSPPARTASASKCHFPRTRSNFKATAPSSNLRTRQIPFRSAAEP